MLNEDIDETPDPDSGPSPRADRWQTIALCGLLIATGILGWSFTLRPALAVDTTPLAALPYAFSGWRGKDIPVEDDVAKLLRADFNLQRVYADPLGGFVWLYVGYYGTERGGRTEHTPWVCYPSAGWSIERAERLTTDEARGLHVNEIVVERGGERRLVHFWFRSHRATGIQTAAGQLLDRMLGRLLAGRADGAFVRVSTPISISGGQAEARTKLRMFGAEVETQLVDHWPQEQVGSS